MAAKAKTRGTTFARPHWQDLTWEDLEAWTDAGTLERGKAYFHAGNVESLALAPSGELLAWVEGNERYAVQVALAPPGKTPKLASLCTCPVGYACKHAVAAVLSYLQILDEGRRIRAARPNDPRLRAFDEDSDFSAHWDEESPEDIEEDNDEFVDDRNENDATITLSPAAVRAALADKSQDELVELAMHLATTLLKIRRQVDQVASVLASANEQKENEEVQETKPSVRLSRRIDRAHRGPRLAKHS